MKKKLILTIIIILLIFFAIFSFTHFSNQNQFKVGSTYFSMPDGYTEGTLNKDGDMNITNGINSVFITKVVNDDLEDNVNHYVDNLEQRNYSLNTIKYNIDGTDVYKVAVGNDSNTTHYWFKKDNQVFTVYSWDVNEHLDDIVHDLVTS